MSPTTVNRPDTSGPSAQPDMGPRFRQTVSALLQSLIKPARSSRRGGVALWELTLRVRARTLIAEGKLPATKPVRAVTGSGSGRSCDLCEEATGRTDIEAELYFAARPLEPYVFHRHCYVIWFAESFRAR